jgi:parallel beta-helix repeat protein
MRRILSFITIIFMLSASILVLEPARAEDKTLMVPAEFATIKEAIQNATDGDTILVKQGTYNETIVIDKAITLRGEDTNNTIINGNNNGTVIQILHDHATITGFTLTYSSTPNTPRRYYQHDFPQGWLKVNGWSAIGYPLDAGYFVRTSNYRLYGIHIQNSANCNITGNRIFNCGVGIWLWKASENCIYGNIFSANDYGLQIESSSNNSIVGNTFTNNGGGLWLPQPNWMSGWGTDTKTVNNTFSQNNFIGNQKAIEPQSLTNTTNYWDNGVNGNYWDHFNGTDCNQNGRSDNPFQIMGQYYTGGYKQYGRWTEKVYATDNYPLMTPFNTTSMFVTQQKPIETQPTQNQTDYTLIELAASIIVVLAFTTLIVYSKKHKKPF